MIFEKGTTRLIGFLIFVTLILLPLQAFAKSFKTNHWKFYAGFMWQYDEDEKKTIDQTVKRLDDIWQHVNMICNNELPEQLYISVKTEGIMSQGLRDENKVLLNSVKIKNGLRDSLTIIAHEATHIGYHKISNGKMERGESEFLDEGIASYAMYAFEPNAIEKKELSLNIAKADLKDGRASLEYLRNWKINVHNRLSAFSKKWREKHPDKYPSLEDQLKVGVNSYFTSCVFVEYLIDLYGLPKFVSAMRNIGNGDSQSTAFQKAMGKAIEDIFIDWHAFLNQSK